MSGGLKGDATYRMCKTKEETITHIVNEYNKLAQLEYKRKNY